MAELARVESVRPGDEVVLAKLGPHVVSAVDEYDESCPCPQCAGAGPTIVVCYFKQGETTYENRARDKSGANDRGGYLVEQSLAPMRRGDLLLVERGRAERARLLRATMERQQAERAAASAERWRRASFAR